MEIVSPAELEGFDCYPVEILLEVDFEKLREAATPGTFLLRLNRRDLVDQLEPTDTGFRVLVSPEDGLRVGSSPPAPDLRGLSRRSAGVNFLQVIIAGPDGRLESDRRRFVVRLDNDQPPTAVAGPDQVAFVGESVRLDGTGSSGPTCTPALLYDWRLVETPDGSAAELSGGDAAEPTFEPDVPGTYVAELVVSNGVLESVADTVSIFVDGIDALAVGPAQSPVLDSLANTVQPVAYDGTQNVSEFDILVIDGDAHSAQELNESGPVNEAFHLGKHLLAVDLTEDHKSAWIFGLMNFASEGATEGIVVQQGKDQTGYPIIRMTEILPPDARQSELENADPDLEDPVDPELDQQRQIDAFTANVLDALRDPTRWDGEISDNPIPPDLIHVRWVNNVDVPWTQTSSHKHGTTGNLQRGSHTTNYTFTLMLDNEPSPQGNSQFLAVQADGEMNPNNAGSKFLQWRKDERAWFQDQIILNIGPGPRQEELWSWVASGPETPNAETTYSNTMSFQVGYSKDTGGSASFGWSSGRSFTISDWGVKALGAQNDQSWDWRSQHPGNTDTAQSSRDGYGDRNAGWFSIPSVYPTTPNELCQTQMQYHSSVAWQSKGLQTGFASIDLGTTQHILDLWCHHDFGLLCLGNKVGAAQWAAQTERHTETMMINLAAVIPIPIVSMVFNPNTVVGGKPVTGVISLKSDALMDTPIALALMDTPIALKSSNKLVATVPSSVTIRKDEVSVAFQVNTLLQQRKTQVAIEAFYAQQFQSVLTVLPEPD